MQNLLNGKNAHAEAFGIIQLVVPGFLTSIKRKSKSQGVQRHQYRQKQRLEATGIGDENYGEHVLVDGLDEVYEWIKRTSEHTMALDENNRVELAEGCYKGRRNKAEYDEQAGLEQVKAAGKRKLEDHLKQLARSRETSWPYDIYEKVDLTDISTSWKENNWEWSKAGNQTYSLEAVQEKERTEQAQLQTKRGADAELH
ncbi:mediator of RNA polymerase II transcription subunit 33A-like [Dorcoceras hygrometricum]|uniref:Mediator of RNA polymerase II transcription subunit 33A-like n=1 Tax=Dorcoceras hygrometricum TaxID=472368 RepID=A0A2Z7DIZ6_9LAMI|nr:mediator of RNA polymerase II transcription subunit 33A-like [Dorcoceras hygrometricum]